MLDTFSHYTQLDAMDCGPTCLRMVAKYYGRSYTLQTLRERSFITREGVSMLGISEAAESIGLRTTGVKVTLEQLKRDVPLPCILHLPRVPSLQFCPCRPSGWRRLQIMFLFSLL
jgi:ATP-binding cassette subfamily B protein